MDCMRVILETDRLILRVWGQGYATEIARALVGYGFDLLDLDRIVGVSYPENRASCRVLEKAGLIYQGRRHAYGQDLEYYTIERNTLMFPTDNHPGVPTVG